MTEAGIAVDVRVEGEPRPVPTGVGLAAYRIIQEALTNVIKHAGPAHASVVVRYTDADVTVEVCDDGRATASAAGGGGHGLVGMRERVSCPRRRARSPAQRPNGGFQVRARLPLGTVE